MKQRAALVLTAMVFAVMAAAQTPPAPPKPGPEVKKLGYFAGTWKLEGEMKPGPMGPGGKFTETDHMQWMDGGFFLVSHAEAKLPTGQSKSTAIFGYDANEKAYTYQEYNSMGETIHARGAVAGDTWTWTNEEKMEGKMMKGRYTVKVTSPTSYTFKFEMQPEGAAWATVMEGTATKQTAAAPAKK